MKGEDRIWLLLARKLAGDAPKEELDDLEQGQQTHPDTTYSLQMLSDLWQAETPRETEPDAGAAFDRHLFRMATKAAGPAKALPPPPRRHLHWRDLLANYFKVSWRSLQRNKGF